MSEQFTFAMELFVREFWGRCAICGSEEDLCIDHWLPLTAGYALDLGNAVVLCRSCNSGKCNRLPEQLYSVDFVVSIAERLQQQQEVWAIRLLQQQQEHKTV